MRLRTRVLLLCICSPLLLVAACFHLNGYLPRTSQSVHVTGFDAPVHIDWDDEGIPHIHARSDADAFRALGYVHAQDRLWQMEFQRRVGTARLSAAVGEAALPVDKFLRTIGLPAAAQRSLDHLDQRTSDVLTQYAQGVNAYLDARSGPLPPEFLLLRMGFEKWTPLHTMVWAKCMSWDLASNWEDEILRARFFKMGFTSWEVMELMPDYPADAATIVHSLSLGRLDKVLSLAHDAGLTGSAQASNSWVVSGRKSATGKPLLANDPHLGTSSPSLWYLAHIQSPNLDVMGGTLPGTPGVLIGRNRHIAWGLTNLMVDNQDLYVYQLKPDDPNQYRVDDKWEPFRIRDELIEVKDNPPVTLHVRESRNGPIIDDVMFDVDKGDAAPVMALRWTGLDDEDQTLSGVLGMNLATSTSEFTNALRLWHSGAQNIVYADEAGNIGMHSVGGVPIRSAGNGTAPVDGSESANDWLGMIPFDELPSVVNPPAGMIVTANNKVMGENYPYFISSAFASPYRYERIWSDLQKEKVLDVSAMQRTQMDTVSLHARQFVKYLRRVPGKDPRETEALATLEDWDGDMAGHLVAPTVFAVWYHNVVETLVADDLGEAFEDYVGEHPGFVAVALSGRGSRDWCDNRQTTRKKESCADIAAGALTRAVAFLSQELGDDVTAWRWDRLHTTFFPHRVLEKVKVLGTFFSIRTPRGGDAFTPNVAPPEYGKHPYEARHHPSYRHIVDMAAPEKSLFIDGTGQSGNPLSKGYTQFNARWRDGEYAPMQMDPKPARISSSLTLSP